MIKEVNFLESILVIKRPIQQINRSTLENQKISQKFGKEYFDGDRKYGYGGYYYDGRWVSVAKKFIEYYKLEKGSSILDIGCAKGFLVKDFRDLGMDAYGVDISEYAIANAHKDIKSYVKIGDARNLWMYPDEDFDLVISINTIHNFDLIDCAKAISEIMRISRKYRFVQVDSWFNEKQRRNLDNWKLTLVTAMGVENWKVFLDDLGYNGEVYWTITE